MNISERISLYDFLTMLVTGLLIFIMLIPWSCIEKYWVLITVFSYIVGLFYHRGLECFRSIIEKAKRPWPFFFGTIFIRNYNEALEKTRKKKEKESTKIEDDYFLAYYYIMDKPCYKNVSVLETQVAFVRNISLLLLLLGVLAFFEFDREFLKMFSSKWINGLFFTGLFVLSFFVRYSTQLKIYKLVWEGFDYTKSMEKKEVVNQNYGLFVCNNGN